jgi:hypothetical protein
MTPLIIPESLGEGGIVSENSPATLISNVMISILEFDQDESKGISYRLKPSFFFLRATWGRTDQVFLELVCHECMM